MLKRLNKYWIFLVITLASLILGILAILTSIKLRQETPVAPTAPESKPRAVEGSPVPACRLIFTLVPQPSPSVSPSPSPSTTPAPSPSVTPSPTPSVSPSPSVTPSPSATPTPSPTCNTTCNTNYQCPANMICYISAGQTSGVCRTPACQADSDCTCDQAAVTSPTPAPTVIPQVPVAGNSLPTYLVVTGGIFLLLIGLALP